MALGGHAAQIGMDMVSNAVQSFRSQPIVSRLSNLQSPARFFDLSLISKPPSNFSEIQSRVSYNLSHFSSNYTLIFLMLLIYALITNFALLFVIVFVVSGMTLIGLLGGGDLTLGSNVITTTQLNTTLACIAIPLGIWASPISTALWLIGASAFTIIGHALLLDKPVEIGFVDDNV